MDKVKELREQWLNEEIILWQLDEISGKDMAGSYDLKRDLMHTEREGSFDNGPINFEFRFLEGEEVDFSSKVVITDIYEL